ncbi:3-hydroxyisobutyrate dehydrogenase, partial [Xanthomonas oryzae pv. oryzae]
METDTMSNIAFIGLGNMGGPMAANLIKAGHQLRAFDLAPAALDAATAAGAHAASSAQDTLADAEIVISMLPASRHVEGLYLGDSGILAQIPHGALVIDCSTIAPLS